MPKVEIELDSAGIQELLKSPEIASACESAAQKRTNATGVPYVPDVRIGKTRVSARGYEKKKSQKWDVCPKCGEAHPNCRCKK